MNKQININTKIIGDINHEPVKRAVCALKRDINNTCKETDEPGLTIKLNRYASTQNLKLQENQKLREDLNITQNHNGQIPTADSCAEEMFTIRRTADEITVTSQGDLGLIYGIYHISRSFLNVQNFWFWNEQELLKENEHIVPDDYYYESKPAKVRFRGWFINDEVLFDGWREIIAAHNSLERISGEEISEEPAFDNAPETLPWEMAFEALLRCGGNMTIPGTDHNSHKYKELANSYGLWITHHHAEPLGAQMFARAYPDLEASFDKHPDLFRKLWKQAIEDQKDCHVIWNLGFRGQGDRPFWADDPTYDTPQARGKLMSDLILEQYKLVKEADECAVCCTNLYGETMELYRDGYLTFPEDVIKIWADNGFGKMVSRRQNNHNPRVYALPKDGDNSAHGIYYHASFYDLQAAAMMTMLPNSAEFVVKELADVYSHNVNDFWIINCSNVKPHTYYLDLIAEMWNQECSGFESTNIVNENNVHIARIPQKEEQKDDIHSFVQRHLDSYVGAYYGKDLPADLLDEIKKAYILWPLYAPKYGPHDDDHAGEQFANHGARILACGFISNFNKQNPEATKSLHELDWICKSDMLLKQVRWHEEKYSKALAGYTEYLAICNKVNEKLATAEKAQTSESIGAADIFSDNLICQVEYLYYSYLGAVHICRAILACLDGKRESGRFIDVLEEGQNGEAIDYLSAFYEAGLAEKAFFEGYETMRSHEHGIWKGFYENDCEADIRQSGYVAKDLMSYLRVLGDGPHFYKWQRKFQKESGGEKVHLILRIKEHLTDEDLWNLMKAADLRY